MNHFAASVARILDDRHLPCGAGFLLRDGFVMTCAHVINSARGKPQMTAEPPGNTERIKLDFPLAGHHEPLEAAIAAWYPPLPEEELPQRPRADIAVLELPSWPQGTGPAPRIARSIRDQWQCRFRSFGFTAADPGGRDADGTLRSEKAERWLEIQDADTIGPFVQPGFSGAPAFDLTTGEILGMVVAASPDEKERRAFLLPSRLLLEAWPLLARPYRGLQAFTEEDSEFFFGRERYVAEISERLQSQAMVSIVGPSGSGKSSILLAGVMPRLKSTGAWRVAVFRPGKDPVANLFEELVSLLEPQATTGLQRLKAMKEARELVGESIAGLVEAARAICHTEVVESLLLVVDQFEELFTLSDPASTQRFIKQFFVDPPAGAPLHWAVTVRADFMGEVQNRADLERAFRDKVEIWPMGDAELTESIERPAHMLDVELEPGLTSLICSAVRGRPALPLLQFLLDQLWQKQNDRKLTHHAYQAVGGLTGALAHHADDVLRSLCREGLDEAVIERTLVPHLVHLSEDGVDTRRVAQRHEFDSSQWHVLQRLADPRARLVVLGRDLEGNETAEVAHEALIRDWPKLRDWANEHRSFGLWLQRTREAAREWKEAGERSDLLLIGTKLEQSQERRDERAAEIARDALVSEFILRSEQAALQLATAREADLIWDRLELSDWLEKHDQEALWDLATSASQTKVAFLSSMLQTEGRARRFNRHPDLCLQAALGMSVALKESTLENVESALRDASVTLEGKTAAVSIGIQLANSPALLARIASNAVQLQSGSQSRPIFLLAKASVARLDVTAAHEILGEILAAMRDTTDPRLLSPLAQIVQALPIKIEAAAAREIFDDILAATRQTVDAQLLYQLPQFAEELAPKIEAAAAREILAAILVALRQTTWPGRLQPLAQIAQGLAPKIEAAEAREILDAILAAMRGPTDPHQLQALVQIALRLPIEIEAVAARDILRAILVAIRRPTDSDQFLSLERSKATQALALAQIAQGLPIEVEAAAAHEILDAVLADVRGTTDQDDLRALTQIAQGLAPKIEAAAARKILDAILADVRETTDSDQLEALTQIAQGLPIGMEAVAHEILDAVLADVRGTTDQDDLRALTQIAQGLAPKIEAAAARKILDAILADVRETTDSDQLEALTQIAQRLPIGMEAAAREIFDAILAAVRQTTDQHQLQGLVQTAQGLPIEIEAAATREILDAVLAAVRQTTHPYPLPALVQTAQELSIGAAREILDAILAAVRQTAHPQLLHSLVQTAQGLSIEIEAAAAREMLDAILAAMRGPTNPHLLQALAQTAQRLAPKIGAAAAHETLDAIFTAVRQTTNPHQLQALVQTAQGLPIKIEAAAAREMLDATLAAVRQTTAPHQLQALVQTVQELPIEIEAAAAREMLDATLAAARQTTDPHQLQALVQTTQGLVQISACLGVSQTDAERTELIDAWKRCLASSPEAVEMCIEIGSLLLEPCADNVFVAAIADAMAFPTIDQGTVNGLIGLLCKRFESLQALHPGKWEIASWIEDKYPDIDLASLPSRPAFDSVRGRLRMPRHPRLGRRYI